MLEAAGPRMPDVYVPRRDSLWECMSPGETHRGSVCSPKRHTLGVYSRISPLESRGGRGKKRALNSVAAQSGSVIVSG